jgi:hypothetical protein
MTEKRGWGKGLYVCLALPILGAGRGAQAQA